MLGAAAVAGAAPPLLPPPPFPGLRSLAAAKGLRFGSCFAWSAPGADRGSFANPAYARLLAAECGLLVPENELKWRALRPSATAFDFRRFDAMLAWAETRHLPVRGHTLLWHQPRWMPAWAESHGFGPRPATEAARLLAGHVRTVCRRYGTRIGGYDVVNEAVRAEDGGLHATALSRAMGGAEPALDLAFRTACEAAPHARLAYNDFMSWEPGHERHRAGVLRLLEGFRRRDVPVDALGVQSHLVTQGPDGGGSASALEGAWRRFLDEVTAMGFDLLVTELDVRDDGLPVAAGPRDRAAAGYVRAYLDVTLSYPQVRDLLVWGLTDRYSWIGGFDPRADGARRRPCPYDASFRPKPMRAAIAGALLAVPARRGDGLRPSRLPA